MSNKGNQDVTDTTSIAALAVALVALIVALGQLLQQYLGTADGFRRCQRSVMGDWAKKTRRRFRWSQFRFEVMFSTPTLTVAPVWQQHLSEDEKVHAFIDGTDRSRALTFSKNEKTGPRRRNQDLVGWTLFIDSLQKMQTVTLLPELKQSLNNRVFRGCTSHPVYPAGEEKPRSNPQMLANPAIFIDERSWDLMPPEITRPVAYSTVSDIIVLAHRLGMGWRSINPGEGIMYAEGNGQSITASTVRGYGLVLQYTRNRFDNETPEVDFPPHYLCIPTMAADKLGFGIIQGSSVLGLPDLSLNIGGNIVQSINSAMKLIGATDESMHMIKEAWADEGWLVGISDLAVLLPPFLPLPNSTIRAVMPPIPNIASPFTWREGRNAFRFILKRDESENSPGLNDLLRRCEEGRERFHWEWRNDGTNQGRRNDADLQFLDWLREQHRFTDDRLTYLCKGSEKEPFSCITLIAAHVSMTPHANIRATENIDNDTKLSDYDELDFGGSGYAPWTQEVFHIYVDMLDRVVDFMKERQCHDEERIREAWWVLMFRGMIWALSVAQIDQHNQIDARQGMIVPSDLWGSQTPVFLA